MRIRIFGLLLILFSAAAAPGSDGFVSVSKNELYLNGQPYYFIGTNYWYGSLLGLEKDRTRGIDRLRRELDFLKANGVTNLRLMGGAEGSGLLNGVYRVGPPLQPEQGRFDGSVAEGLDLVLSEMAKRGMKAVIFFSNNWEWSGGFQQYLLWNEQLADRLISEKPSWDELRDAVSKFYDCGQCKAAYLRQVDYLLSRRNKFNGRRYIVDPTIMAWEIANEPRPMRPAANEAYKRFIAETAAHIRSRDRLHLITIGHEGWIGTEDIRLFETIHSDPNVDYATIHIWPKNWGWFAAGKMEADFPNVVTETRRYIEANAAAAARIRKPFVIEEFGLPRDGMSFDPTSPTTYRDRYYELVLAYVRGPDPKTRAAGANFWAFGGTARPAPGQPFWKKGDELTGDPPMEEQGLNSVFDTDLSTWKTIRSAALKASASRQN